MLYFAYGSNLSQLRLRQRVNAELVCSGKIIGYQLRFHKPGEDGSAKCDAYYTGKPDDLVFGVLYRIDQAGKAKLDRYEGDGYRDKQIYVIDLEDEVHHAFTYVARITKQSLVPFDWYHQHVLVGARQAMLPQGYIEKIQNIKTIEDSNHERSCMEKSLYI